jgi:multicomponent Na+:H+ antiporter subunit D
MGIAMAGNLFTFFIFYELLTLATWPLIVHRGTRRPIAGGRTYLAYTLGGSALLLVGLVGCTAWTGPQDFISQRHADALGRGRGRTCCGHLRAAGRRHGREGGAGAAARLAAAGHGGAGAGERAAARGGGGEGRRLRPGAPGRGRLRARAGGALGVASWLALPAAFTIVYGSLRRWATGDLKKRLAWSTVSQVSYVVLGVAWAGRWR